MQTNTDDLKEGLRVQTRVIYAIIIREMRTRFGNKRLGYLWAIIDPVLWILTFYALFYYIDRQIPFGMDAIGFLTTGLITFILYRTTVVTGLIAIRQNLQLLFYPQVYPIDLSVARAILEFATMSVVFIILMAGSSLLRDDYSIDSPHGVVVALLLSSLLGASGGMFFGALSVYMESIENIVNIVLRPMFWISGIWFAVAEFPADIRNILLLNPVLHIVEYMRASWYESFQADYIDLRYPAAWIVVTMYFALVMERRSRRDLQF